MSPTAPLHQRASSAPRSPTSPLVPLERRPSPSSAAIAAANAGLPTMADVVLGQPISLAPGAATTAGDAGRTGMGSGVGLGITGTSTSTSVPTHRTISANSRGPRRASASSLPTPNFAPSTPPNRPTPISGQFGPTPSTPSLRVGDAIDANGAPRNIVILLDGTGNQFSAKNSNVIKMLSVLEADETQLLYYSSGVGTVLPDHASTWGKIRAGIAETTDKMLAWNHVDFLCNAYKYLMDYYRAGDKVYIFGFSRGAYTARALAGMIQKVGLLPPGNHNQIKLAYEVYLSPTSVKTRGGMGANMKEDAAVMYRQIFGISRAVRIEFLGVWDTVSSLGGIFLPRLPFAGNVKSVKFFRQALALDERRARFAPEYRYLWQQENPCESAEAKSTLLQARDAYKRLHSAACAPQERFDAREDLKHILDAEYPCVAITDPIPTVSAGEGGLKQKIWKKNKEVWFMGCHSDVGGGNDVNMRESLSNIPFRWMLREAVRCGIKLEPAGIALQPALYTSELVHKQGLIPAELIKILKDELRGDIIEFDNEARVKAIIDQTLPYSRLVEIVELAAAFDSAMDHKDSKDGAPLGADALMDSKESLTAWWAPLEVTLLQTRRYGGGIGENKDVWRLNLGRGRQIVPGHAIHRSVLKRLRHDRPVDSDNDTALERIRSALCLDDYKRVPEDTASGDAGQAGQTAAEEARNLTNADGVPDAPTADIRVSPASTPSPNEMLSQIQNQDQDLDIAAQATVKAVQIAANAASREGAKGKMEEDDKASSSSSSTSLASETPDTIAAAKIPAQPTIHGTVTANAADGNSAPQLKANKEVSQSKAENKDKTPKMKKKSLFKVGDSSQSLRGIRAGKEKKMYREPKAMLPIEWATDWDELRMGGGPAIWED